MRQAHTRGLLGLLLAISVSLLACGADEAGLILEYPNSASADRASTVSVYVFRSTSTVNCSQLTRATNPTSPDDDRLIEAASAVRRPAEDIGLVLSDLSPAQYRIYAEAHDVSGSRFLAGCIDARLSDGGSIRVELEELFPDVIVPDAGVPDAIPVDAAPADAGPPPLLNIAVNSMFESSVDLQNAEVIVSDSTAAADVTGATNAVGEVTLNVEGLTPPLTVTAVAVEGDFTSASTLIGIEPDFAGAQMSSDIRMAIDLGTPLQSGTGGISGNVSNVGGGPNTAVVSARSTFTPGPYESVPTIGAYSLAGLPTGHTYSVMAFRAATAGSPVAAVDIAATVLVSSGVTTGINLDASSSLVNVPVAVTLDVNASGITGDATYRSNLLLPFGALAYETITPATNGTENLLAPQLNAAIAGAARQFELEQSSVDSSRRSEARLTSSSSSLTLTLPAPPTIANPAEGAMIAVNNAKTLTLQFGAIFAENELVHVTLTGTGGGGEEYRWHLMAPANTNGLTLPALPSGFDVIVANQSYDVEFAPQSVAAAFTYATDIYADFATFLFAFDIPQRARTRNTFTVTP